MHHQEENQIARLVGVVWSACDKFGLSSPSSSSSQGGAVPVPWSNRIAYKRGLLSFVKDANDTLGEFGKMSVVEDEEYYRIIKLENFYEVALSPEGGMSANNSNSISDSISDSSSGSSGLRNTTNYEATTEEIKELVDCDTFNLICKTVNSFSQTDSLMVQSFLDFLKVCRGALKLVLMAVEWGGERELFELVGNLYDVGVVIGEGITNIGGLLYPVELDNGVDSELFNLTRGLGVVVKEVIGIVRGSGEGGNKNGNNTNGREEIETLSTKLDSVVDARVEEIQEAMARSREVEKRLG